MRTPYRRRRGLSIDTHYTKEKKKSLDGYVRHGNSLAENIIYLYYDNYNNKKKTLIVRFFYRFVYVLFIFFIVIRYNFINIAVQTSSLK